MIKKQNHILYIAPNPMAGARCNVYLIDNLSPGANPRDASPDLKQQWKHIAILDASQKEQWKNFKLVVCEKGVHDNIKEDLEYGAAGNIYAVVLSDGKLYYPEDAPKRNLTQDSPSP